MCACGCARARFIFLRTLLPHSLALLFSASERPFKTAQNRSRTRRHLRGDRARISRVKNNSGGVESSLKRSRNFKRVSCFKNVRIANRTLTRAALCVDTHADWKTRRRMGAVKQKKGERRGGGDKNAQKNDDLVFGPRDRDGLKERGRDWSKGRKKVKRCKKKTKRRRGAGGGDVGITRPV